MDLDNVAGLLKGTGKCLSGTAKCAFGIGQCAAKVVVNAVVDVATGGYAARSATYEEYLDECKEYIKDGGTDFSIGKDTIKENVK